MKKSIIIVSKMNCSYLAKQLCSLENKNFCDLYEKIVSSIGDIADYKKLHGEDNYLAIEKEFLTDLLVLKDYISFVSYDIFKHNIDIEMYSDVYIVMLDFGYFIRKGNEIVRMKQSIRYQKAKSICDLIIDCRNMGEDKILKNLKRVADELQ